MKPLYRVLYVREGQTRGVTIAAPSVTDAHRIARRLCRRWSDNGDWQSIMPFEPKRRPRRHPQRELELEAPAN